MPFQKSSSVTCDLNPLASGGGDSTAHLGADYLGRVSKDTRKRNEGWKHTGEAVIAKDGCENWLDKVSQGHARRLKGSLRISVLSVSLMRC